MLLPAGIKMNDLLALAEEMDPLGSPGKADKADKRGLTSESTMQLASYLATKVPLLSGCATAMHHHCIAFAEPCLPLV